MTKPKHRDRPRPEPAPERLISPPGHCPNWRDDTGLRHGCRSHPSTDVCRCPCGATHYRRELTDAVSGGSTEGANVA